MKEHAYSDSYIDFLAAFHGSENRKIHFRAFKPKGSSDNKANRPLKLGFTRTELKAGTGDSRLKELNETRGIYFVPNSGGHTDADIKIFTSVFIERDDVSIDEQHRLLDESPISTSIRVETKRSVHAYWLLTPGTNLRNWRMAQRIAINHFYADRSNKNPSRLMRLPGFDHLSVRDNGSIERTLVRIVQFEPKRRYSILELLSSFNEHTMASTQPLQRVDDPTVIIANGQRNTTLFSIAGKLRRAGLRESEIFTSLKAINGNRVKPPLDEAELKTISKGIMRYSDSALTDVRSTQNLPSCDRPTLKEAAFHGPAGEIVKTILPNTEADAAALLIQFLAGFGCQVGRSAYFVAEADEHYTKVNAVLVGISSKARKGTSWGHVRRLLIAVDESFDGCIVDGLASGEGLIQQVRDPRPRRSRVANDDNGSSQAQADAIDEGAADKRLFVLEPEFARVLRVMQREGNTLSPLIRQAWDSDRLHVMTKQPLRATGTQITIVAHITVAELDHSLSRSDIFNGFANRFLWFFTERSKELPFGGNLAEEDLKSFVHVLRQALEFAHTVGELKRSSEADDLWAAVYGRLSRCSPDLVGAVTSRAEAQVMRVALIYAVLDRSRVIEKVHLEAALSVWGYSEESARYIFGNHVGDKVADRIRTALFTGEAGLTGTEIQNLFKRNVSSEHIQTALRLLQKCDLIRMEQKLTGGRSANLYFAASRESG